MNNENWVKLYKKFTSWAWYKDQNTKSLFLHCILKANWNECIFEGKIIPRGSFVTSIKALQDETGMTPQQIRTALKHLMSTKELTSKNYSKYRVITVLNYELYQQTNKQQATNKQNEKNVDFLTEFLTTMLTKLEDDKTLDFKGKNDVAEYLLNKVFNKDTNKQLTSKEEKKSKKQQQYKNNIKEKINKKEKEKKEKRKKSEESADEEKVEENIFQIIETEFGRLLSPLEYEIVDSWDYPLEVLKMAIKEAVASNVCSLKYINKIIFDWKRKNLKTVEDVTKYLANFNKAKTKNEDSKSNSEVEDKEDYYEVFDDGI